MIKYIIHSHASKFKKLRKYIRKRSLLLLPQPPSSPPHSEATNMGLLPEVSYAYASKFVNIFPHKIYTNGSKYTLFCTLSSSHNKIFPYQYVRMLFYNNIVF